MIEFSYDPSTAVGLVRLYAGDTDAGGLSRVGGERTRTDAEVTALLGQSDDDPQLAAARLLEGKAAEFASSAIEIVQGDLRQDYRERSSRLLEAAAALRSSVSAPVGWNPPSQDAPFTLGAGGTMTGW
jgi:hypothetical protein